MADETSRARDEYEIYYAEKIWALVPEVYRAEDAEGTTPDVLREFVEVIAEQAAITRRSIDRLWEDQNIETCDDWAVPYIGDLLATRLLSERDPRARRVDVARTIHYRRRRGTPSLLEALVREISGWDVVLVEAFRRLVRAPHRLDTFPVPLGRVTRTAAGGTANLRHARSSEVARGPFDEFFHTPDVRQLHGQLGRFNIPKLNFHLFRLRAYGVVDATPVMLQDPGPVTFTVDPSGRDIPLFSRGVPVNSGSLKSCGPPWADLPTSEAKAQELDECERRCLSTREWEVAQPLTCRMLSDAAFVLSLEDVIAAKEMAEGNVNAAVERAALDTLAGWRFENEARLRARLTQLGVSFSPAQPNWYRELLRNTVTDDSTKRNLLPLTDGGSDDAISDVPISLNLFFDSGDELVQAFPFDATTGADLSSRACHPVPADIGIQLLVDPELGRFAYPQAQVLPPEVEDPDPKPDPSVEPFEDFVPPDGPEPEPPAGDAPSFEAPVPDEPEPDPTPDPSPDPGPDPTPDPEPDPEPDPTPPEVSVDEVALFARSGRLQVGGDNSSVLGENGSGFATIASAGNQLTLIQAGSNQEFGDVWSVPDVLVGNNVHIHGSLRSGGDITLQAGAVVDGAFEENASLSGALSALVDSLDFTVAFPTAGANTTANSGNSPLILAPHASGQQTRGNVTIDNGGTLRLSSGVYFFESLTAEPSGTLQIDATSGKVYVFVRGNVNYKSALTLLAGAPNDFVLVAMGTAVTFDGTHDYKGVVLAPAAQLELRQSVTYEGAYFAATVLTQPGQTFILDPWDGTLPSEYVTFGGGPSLMVMGRRAARAPIASRAVVVSGGGLEFTVTIQAPAGLAYDEILLHVDGGPLQIAGNVLQGASGGGTVVNLSSQATTIGPNARVGDVWTNGTVTLENGTHVDGVVRTSATGAGAVVINGTVTSSGPAQTGVALNLQNVPIPSVPATIVFTNDTTAQDIAGSEVVTLPPGQHGIVTVQEGAFLKLGPGEYRMTELHLHGTLILDLSAPIRLAVRNALTWSGTQRVLWGSTRDFTLLYFGTNALTPDTGFAGRLFAPRAQLVLGQLTGGQFSGAFFASSMSVQGNTPVLGFVGDALAHLYFYGFPGNVGAGPYNRALPKPIDPAHTHTAGGVLPASELLESGALTLASSRTFRLAVNQDHQIVDAAIQADELERPYLLLEGGAGSAIAELFPKAPVDANDREARKFALSGVWVGSLDATRSDWVIERAIPGTPEIPTISGFDWEEIVIRHATLDPGGVRADCLPIAPVRLVVRGRVETLVIEDSIVASIVVDAASEDARIERLVIRNSIVDAQRCPLLDGRATAIANPVGSVELDGVTVFGDVRAGVLRGENSIVMGRLVVANTQDSCFRFSAASLGDLPVEGEDDAGKPRLPKLFRVPDIAFIEPHFFGSLRFGDPGYGQLSLAAPEALATGAENTSEMGAFSFLLRPIKLSSVLTKVDEFKPVAVLPQFILENESVSELQPACEPAV